MEGIDSVCLKRSLAFSGTQTKMESLLIAEIEMNIYDLLQHKWRIWKGILFSLNQRSARTRVLNRTLYTKMVHLYASDRLHFFQFFFFSLKQMDLTFLPFHNSTFIWILEFGQLPGLRFRYSSLWMIKIKRRRRHGKGSIFSWSTGWDDQRAVRCSAEHAFHCSSSIWREEFFFIQGICGLHIKWHPSNGSQHSHSWIMTPCSCASAAAHYGSMHPCSPQPGLE